MQRFTFMSEEAVTAIRKANDEFVDQCYANGTWKDGEHKYRLELMPSEFGNLLAALLYVWQRCQDSDPYPDIQADVDLPEWAGSFVSSIAQTFGIEMI